MAAGGVGDGASAAHVDIGVSGSYRSNMRLRILDWNTRWFWLTIFRNRSIGEPIIAVSVWHPHTWARWIHVWQWEPIPTFTGGYAETSESEKEGSHHLTAM